jgi:hypothetical protein
MVSRRPQSKGLFAFDLKATESLIQDKAISREKTIQLDHANNELIMTGFISNRTEKSYLNKRSVTTKKNIKGYARPNRSTAEKKKDE